MFPISHNGKTVDATGRAIGKRYLNGNDMEKVACHTHMVVVKSQLLLRTV